MSEGTSCPPHYTGAPLGLGLCLCQVAGSPKQRPLFLPQTLGPSVPADQRGSHEETFLIADSEGRALALEATEFWSRAYVRPSYQLSREPREKSLSHQPLAPWRHEMISIRPENPQCPALSALWAPMQTPVWVFRPLRAFVSSPGR
uniref:Uncharacterized protein n=1 Tax=Pipistrellus kuhlii TaxID=59472 RepID=A0A7J7UTC8_PIPKU|nr:hypothetical protein mPipKuh1_008684 [Pipistrellus kuhlii]